MLEISKASIQTQTALSVIVPKFNLFEANFCFMIQKERESIPGIEYE